MDQGVFTRIRLRPTRKEKPDPDPTFEKQLVDQTAALQIRTELKGLTGQPDNPAPVRPRNPDKGMGDAEF